MKNKLALCAAVFSLFVLIFASGEVITYCRGSLSLCAELILPSLFPFMIVSILLSRLGLPTMLGRAAAPLARRLFGVSGAGATALIIGLCGGYPLGAAYVSDMAQRGAISRREGERLLGFCNNSGPAFIIGAVGVGTFASARVGIYLYAIHAVSAILTGIIFRLCLGRIDAPPHSEEHDARNAPPTLAYAITAAIKEACISAINICGFVICFGVVVGLIDSGGMLSLIIGRLSAITGLELHALRALITGMLELGTGTGALRALRVSPPTLALAAFLLGWGGVSVHFQTMAVICDGEMNGALHLAGRLICAIIASILAYGLYFML